MRLLYIANARIPTEKAHGLQIVKTCEAFAKAGADVELVLPKRRNRHGGELHTNYGVEKNFSVHYLPTLELPFWIPGAFILQTITFALSVKRYIGTQAIPDVVYTRGEMMLPLSRIIPKEVPLVWETHIKPGHWERYAQAVHSLLGIVVVTQYFANEISSLWGVEGSRVLTAPDGVSLDSFAESPSKEEARKRLGLPFNRKIVLYAGSDLPWKGVRYLRQASNKLPRDFLTIFVGPIVQEGNKGQQLFAGVRPYAEIPLWLAAADVLVLTGDPKSDIAQHYTSPMKLFEYLAAERPIVATDIASFREVLDESVAYLVRPGDTQALAAAIQTAAESPKSKELARNAREMANQYTWDSRAQRILAFILNLIPGHNLRVL